MENKDLTLGLWYIWMSGVSLFWFILKLLGILQTPLWCVFIPLMIAPLVVMAVCLLVGIILTISCVISIPLNIKEYLNWRKENAKQKS